MANSNEKNLKMKKYFFFFSLFTALLVLSGCGDDEELQRLQAENDSLRNVNNESQAQIDQFMAGFNDIQENLNTIKQKEHIIDLNTADSSEMTPDMVNQVNNDVLLIYELMEENKQALEILKQQIRNSGVKNQQLEQTITLYEEQMLQKDEEISLLKDRLEDMDFNMQQLNDQIADMQSNIDTITQINQQQDQTINDQDQDLHRAYYVVGTKDELKDNGILTRDGVLSGFSLDPNFDKTYFTEIDYRNLNEIPLNNNKIEILTQHPSSSYILEGDNNKTSKMLITNKDDFWEVSKFLVILIK